MCFGSTPGQDDGLCGRPRDLVHGPAAPPPSLHQSAEPTAPTRSAPSTNVLCPARPAPTGHGEPGLRALAHLCLRAWWHVLKQTSTFSWRASVCVSSGCEARRQTDLFSPAARAAGTLLRGADCGCQGALHRPCASSWLSPAGSSPTCSGGEAGDHGLTSDPPAQGRSARPLQQASSELTWAEPKPSEKSSSWGQDFIPSRGVNAAGLALGELAGPRPPLTPSALRVAGCWPLCRRGG